MVTVHPRPSGIRGTLSVPSNYSSSALQVPHSSWARTMSQTLGIQLGAKARKNLLSLQSTGVVKTQLSFQGGLEEVYG